MAGRYLCSVVVMGRVARMAVVSSPRQAPWHTRMDPMRTRIVARWLVSVVLVASLGQLMAAQDDQLSRMRTELASPARSAENKARDSNRKPVESIQFFGIRTGDTVVDMIAAGGWFTEV